VELGEWLMYEPVTEITRESLGESTWALKMKVFRKCHYYLTSVIAIMGCIATLVYFSFIFEPSEWGCRSAYCATLLLTSVAFKFAVDGSLPKVSFTTILDLYMLVAFGMMVGVVVEAALVKFIQRAFELSDQRLARLDVTLAATMSIIWTLWNIIYLARFVHFEKMQREHLGKLLTQVVTNDEAKERCRSFFCSHKEALQDAEDEREQLDEVHLEVWGSNGNGNSPACLGRDCRQELLQYEVVG